MAEPQVPIIVLAFADPKGDLPSVKEELWAVEAALEGAIKAGLCEVVKCYPARPSDIIKAFRDYPNRVAVFHYGGHADLGQLIFEQTAGNAQGLAQFLKVQEGLQLVFLNGCHTEGHLEGLQAANIPAVIATTEAIPDKTASKLAGEFYKGLAAGHDLEKAYAEAVAAVQLELDEKSEDERTRELVKTLKQTQRWPWEPHFLDEAAKTWSLTTALNDPLISLPKIPEEIGLPAKPFRHLSWFRREDARIFFGRGKTIAELYHRICDSQADPILLLYGQSGVGKSSLLEAGLMPRLESAHRVLYVRRDAQLGLWGSLLKALGTLEGQDPSTLWSEKERSLGRPLVVILDQLEEAYSRTDTRASAERELEGFARGLKNLFSVRPKGKLVLSFRKEWLAEIETALAREGLPVTKLLPLEALNRDEIRESIRGPTKEHLYQKYHLSISQDLAKEMAQDLLDRNSPIAPTLQLTLTKMWDKESDWDEVRGIAQAQPPFEFDPTLFEAFQHKGLGEILDQQLRELAKTHPNEVASGLVLDLLHYHTTAQGTAEQRSEDDLYALYGPERRDQIASLLLRAKDKYLLTEPSGTSAKGSRLSHDTLAPYIRERFGKSQLPGQRARRVLENRVVDWRGGSKGIPLDERDIELVERGQAGMRGLDPDEQILLCESRKQHDEEVAKSTAQLKQIEDERTAKEAERQLRISEQDRSLKKQRKTIALLIVVGISAILFGLFAQQQRVLAEMQENRARVRQWMSRGLQLLDKGDPMGLFLLAKVHDDTRSWESRAALFLGLASQEDNLRVRHQINPYQAEDEIFSNDATQMASIEVNPDWGMATAITIWDVESRKPIRSYDIAHLRINDFQQGDLVFFSSKKRYIVYRLAEPGSLKLIRLDGPKAQQEDFSGLNSGLDFEVSGSEDENRLLVSYLVDRKHHICMYLVAQKKCDKKLPLPIMGQKNTIKFFFTRSPNILVFKDSSFIKTIDLKTLKTSQQLTNESMLDFVVHGEHMLIFEDINTHIQVLLFEMKEPKFVQVHSQNDFDRSILSDGLILNEDGTELNRIAFDPQHHRVVALAKTETGLAILYSWSVSELFTQSLALISPSNLTSTHDGRLLITHDLPQDGIQMSVFRISDALTGNLGTDNRRLTFDTETISDIIAMVPGQTAQTPSRLYDIAMARENHLVFSLDEQVYFWGGTPDSPTIPLLPPGGKASSVALSPNGTIIALAGDDQIRLLDAMSRKIQFRAKLVSPTTVSFSPNGKYVVAGHDGGKISLWDSNLDANSKVDLLLHNAAITGLVFSPDGEVMFSSSVDGTVGIWEMNSKSFIQLVKLGTYITSIDYNPHTNVLSLAQEGKPLRQWDWSDDVLISRACDLIQRTPQTAGEWRSLFGADVRRGRTCSEN